MALTIQKNGQATVSPNHLYDQQAGVVTHPLQRNGTVATPGFHAPRTSKPVSKTPAELAGLKGTRTHTSSD